MVDKRRSEDMSDDLALFLGVPASTDGEVEEVDELGRSRRDFEAGPSSGVRRARRAEREARRSRRKPTHSQRPSEDEEGFSTLAEADAEDYAHAHHHLEKRVYSLLEDVRAEDFRDPEKGLAIRFGDWRMRYEEEYVNAFGGLSMVQAWEFWARGEMVGWEPLRVGRLVVWKLGSNADANRDHPRLNRSSGSRRCMLTRDQDQSCQQRATRRTWMWMRNRRSDPTATLSRRWYRTRWSRVSRKLSRRERMTRTRPSRRGELWTSRR
jgi:GC-rich sequence DNA-binding factor